MMGTKRKRDDQTSRLEYFKDTFKFRQTLSNLNFEEADYDYLFILGDIFSGRIKLDGDVDDKGNGLRRDPDYEQFLNHITTDSGGSYTLRTPAGDKPSVFVKYDEKRKKTKRRSSDFSDFNDSQTVKGAEKSETEELGEVPKARPAGSQLKSKPPRTSDAIARKARLESRRFRKSMLDGQHNRIKTSLKGDKRRSSTIPVVDSEARAPVSCHPCGSLGDRVPLESSPPPQPDFKGKNETRLHDADELYGWFLGCLEQRRDEIVFRPSDHEELIYDKHEESTSDSDVMIIDDAPFLDGGVSPFVSSKVLVQSVDEDMDDYQCTEQSQFRVKLIKCIEEPYDELQYIELLEKMREKKPIDRHRENRRGLVKGCPLKNKLGLSYLEHHKDFANKFESVHDKHKRLQLLRAFFFWLMNSSHDDNFRPWMDAPFLKMVLRGGDQVSVA